MTLPGFEWREIVDFKKSMSMTVYWMFARTKLVVNGTTLEVNTASLTRGCKLFAQNPILLQTPYSVRSSCSLSIVQDFVTFVEGGKVMITPQNVSALWLICEEFGFEELLQQFRQLGRRSEDEMRNRFQTYDEAFIKHERRLADLEMRVQSHERLLSASVMHDRPSEFHESASPADAHSDRANSALDEPSRSEGGSGGAADTITVTFNVRVGPLGANRRKETRTFRRDATIAMARAELSSIAELTGYRLVFERDGRELSDDTKVSDDIQVKPIVRVRLGHRVINIDIFSGTERSRVDTILKCITSMHPVGSAAVYLRKAGESDNLPTGVSIRGLAVAGNECLEVVGVEFDIYEFLPLNRDRECFWADTVPLSMALPEKCSGVIVNGKYEFDMSRPLKDYGTKSFTILSENLIPVTVVATSGTEFVLDIQPNIRCDIFLSKVKTLAAFVDAESVRLSEAVPTEFLLAGAIANSRHRFSIVAKRKYKIEDSSDRPRKQDPFLLTVEDITPLSVVVDCVQKQWGREVEPISNPDLSVGQFAISGVVKLR